MKAVILAAGEGTRLRPLTLDTPKPLLSVGERTVIERVIENLPDEVTEVILVVEYMKEKIKSYLGESFAGKKISYVEQGSMKGTYGALLSAKGLLNDGELFMVLNADDLHDKKELEALLVGSRSMGLQKMVMPNYYSTQIDTEGNISGFRKQTDEEKVDGALVAAGVYVLDKNIFDHPGVMVSGGEYGLPQTILEQKDTYPVRGIIATRWIPINSIADLENANKSGI